MSADETERWMPDEALVPTLHTRSLPIAGLSGPDRAWAVAALTVEGWTVAAIADRLRCSLRLIQQIKAEPMTLVAMHALALEQRLRHQDALGRLANLQHSRELTERDSEVSRLRRQRDILMQQLTNRRTSCPSPSSAPPVTT